MRGPARFTLGTLWSQSRWVRPPVTRRSPRPRTKARDAPPPFGRRRNVRGSPSDTSATIGSSISSAIRSPCQATLPPVPRVEKHFEQVVRSRDPAGAVFDPRAFVEGDPLEPSERAVDTDG